MDIARPEFKRQKLRRTIAFAAVGIVVIAALTVVVWRLKPAAPSVERGTVWTDTVKHGSMLRQVRGPGSLVPTQEAVRQIPAETEATVVRIRVLPGSQVKADTILLEMSNPPVEQAAVDARLQLQAAEAEYQSFKVKLDSDLMTQRAGAATVNAAELLGWQERVGALESGHYADLIAVEGDPLGDITVLQHVKFVMKGGALVKDEISTPHCSK